MPALFQSAADATVSGDFVSDGVGVGAPNGTGYAAGPSATTSSVTFEFDVRASGNYQIVGTVQSPNGRDDSFWVTLNGAPNEGWLWDTGRRSDYGDATVGHRGESGPKVVWLDAGPNQVTMSLREDGTYISAVQLVPA